MILEASMLTAFFWMLVLWHVRQTRLRASMFSRRIGEWVVDVTGLLIHGVVVPLVQMLLVAGVLSVLLPSARGSLHVHAGAAFVFNFIIVDYLYYWNHRLLHHPRLWRFHALHHSGPTFDVFATSRNSAITTFLILYVWINGAALYFIAEPAAYAWAIVASNMLDILRHARITAWPDFFPLNLFTSPRDHAWHHSHDVHEMNFGGNFNIWDKLHGTYHASDALPDAYGDRVKEGGLWSAFWKGLA